MAADLQIFREISIGGITQEQLMSRLQSEGIQFNSYAHTLFAHPLFTIGEKNEKVRLVKVSLTQLQINEPCFFPEIVQRAADFNLQLCPLSLGAFLRLEYLDQPEGPYLTIASEKPEQDENYPNGFYIRNFEGQLWLRGYRASDDYPWSLDSEFIFLR